MYPLPLRNPAGGLVKYPHKAEKKFQLTNNITLTSEAWACSLVAFAPAGMPTVAVAVVG